MSGPVEVTPLASLLAVVASISLVGFFTATSSGDYSFDTPLRQLPVREVAGDAEPARAYGELRSTSRGGAPVLEADLASLRAAVPARDEAVPPARSSKWAALAGREARRAFYGAPPVIPHPVQQLSQAECVACHESGIRLAGRAAPPYPHDQLVSCTQCHAMAEPALPWDPQALPADARAVRNSFVGARSPTRGERWTAIAPPQVPHGTFMNERCISCHGPNGREAMRSTHPERQSCLQCHATDAVLEGQP